MPRDLTEAFAILKENGLDFGKIVRDTHTETMMKIGAILDDTLEISLKYHRMMMKQPIDEKMFQKGGKLQHLGAKITKAARLGILGKVSEADADVIRVIRNVFGHLQTKVHFESPEIIVEVEKFSTFDPNETVQNNIFAATTSVFDQLKAHAEKCKEVLSRER